MKRTDLAIEALETITDKNGIISNENTVKGFNVITTKLCREAGGRAAGEYITVEAGDISGGLLDTIALADVVAGELRILLGNAESALVIGLGNTDITPDALGPRVADRVLATRHLSAELKAQTGLSGLRSVSVIAPGVLGQTGMESAEVIKAICGEILPDVVIAVDALAAADVKRLGNTVQLSSAGISPGSGVGNRRRELSQKTLGLPVIGIGIPTVADSASFGGEGGYIVTPREIDMLISRAGELLGDAINFALQPETEKEFLLSLV